MLVAEKSEPIKIEIQYVSMVTVLQHSLTWINLLNFGIFQDVEYVINIYLTFGDIWTKKITIYIPLSLATIWPLRKFNIENGILFWVSLSLSVCIECINQKRRSLISDDNFSIIVYL